MRDIVSRMVYHASWLAVILTGLATIFWLAIVGDGNYCWAAFGFAMGIAMPLGGSTFLLGIIQFILYRRKQQHRDSINLWLTAGSFLVLCAETFLLLCVIPQRGE